MTGERACELTREHSNCVHAVDERQRGGRVNGALKAAWALTAFVVLVGLVGWIVTGEVFFAFFLVLGVLTAIGAVMTGRSVRKENDSR